MNGIYNFDNYHTPYLDVEMLMERQEKKRRRQMLILSCIAAVLMAAVSVITLVATSLINQTLFIVLVIGFGIYMIVGAICAGRFMKNREEELWHQLV